MKNKLPIPSSKSLLFHVKNSMDKKYTVKAASKPNFVPGAVTRHRGHDHSSWMYVAATSCNLPGSSDGQPSNASLFGLALDGVYQLLRSPGELVRSYRTVSPLPCCFQGNNRAVYSLLHFPSRCRDSTLWSVCPAVFGLSSRSAKIQRSYSLLPPYIILIFSYSAALK